MRWVKVASVLFLIILTQSLAKAETDIVNSVIKIDISKIADISFTGSLALFKNCAGCDIPKKPAIPISTKIEDISRLQNIVNRCI